LSAANISMPPAPPVTAEINALTTQTSSSNPSVRLDISPNSAKADLFYYPGVTVFTAQVIRGRQSSRRTKSNPVVTGPEQVI